MAKENSVNIKEAEIKAVAKAAGEALSRAGHKVPHSALLHAMAAALNRRDWHKLKAALEHTSDATSVEAAVLAERERCMRVYAYWLGVGQPDSYEARCLANLRNPTPQDMEHKQLDLQAAAALPDRVEMSATDDVVLFGSEVRCKFWTDDHVYEVEFDGRPYFMQAADKELVAIIEVGYGGDYETDNIAEFMASRNKQLAEAFEYHNAINRAPGRDSTGFECRVVDVTAYLKWMDEFRRPALAKCLCDRAGILLREIKESDREDGATWEWEEYVGGQQVDDSTTLFQTKEEAAVDAYLKKNLLQQAIDRDL